MSAVFQAEGGFLVPELCIEGHVSIARRFGAVIHERERVLGWEPVDTGVRVHTDHGVYAARSLVVTAGAWAGQVIQELHEIAVPERQVMAWFEPLTPALFKPSRFPVFIVTWNDDEYYGFPAYGVPGFKVGKFHHVGEDVDPDYLDRRYRTEDEHMLRDFTDACFPQAAGRLLKMTTCMFTNSPDRHFIIGQHSTYPQVSFAAGFSGHGFKFCSTVGEVMADLADRGKTNHDISSFDPARFET
jgi:sarcosine oxidase